MNMDVPVKLVSDYLSTTEMFANKIKYLKVN